MSDAHRKAQDTSTSPGTSRGQALVEFALILPLLLLLLLAAIDFGRVFFGWVAVHNAARVGANYAATHPDAWAAGNTAEQEEYERLIRDAGADNCGLYDSGDPPPPAFPDGRQIGDRVRVSLSCEFTLVNPMMGPWTGPIPISASATFNVRKGCVDCAALPPGPPPPAQVQCRTIPNLIGLSVGGAKLAWQSAGFTGPVEPSTADDWRTVAYPTVDQGAAVGCDPPQAFFGSAVTLTLTVIVEPSETDTCQTVPNVLGMSVAAARTTWESAGFDPDAFTPNTGADDQIVSAVTYVPPDATHGQCREPDELAVEVQYVAPPPSPPTPPCKVPSFVNTLRANAPATWTAAEFTGPIEYQGGTWTVVGKQDLVGGSFVACTSTIKLSK